MITTSTCSVICLSLVVRKRCSGSVAAPESGPELATDSGIEPGKVGYCRCKPEVVSTHRSPVDTREQWFATGKDTGAGGPRHAHNGVFTRGISRTSGRKLG